MLPPHWSLVAASLQQLIAAARLPNSGICEIAVNAGLAFIEGAKPRNEIECALVIQIACTHSAAMAVLNRLGGASGDRTVAAMASAAARLLRAYAAQVEALRRLRNGGCQTVRVEHVYVNEGGQAIIGNVRERGRRTAANCSGSAARTSVRNRSKGWHSAGFTVMLLHTRQQADCLPPCELDNSQSARSDKPLDFCPCRNGRSAPLRPHCIARSKPSRCNWRGPFALETKTPEVCPSVLLPPNLTGSESRG